MTRFEFATANRIIFGLGTLAEAGPLAKAMGHHALVVTGKSVSRAQPLLEALKAQEVAATVFPLEGEPTTSAVQRGVESAGKASCDHVIAFGGGSALDAGKAIAALLTNGGELLDYLEVIGEGRALNCPSAPMMAIPTTAGTGAEVTRNAVLGSREHRVKASLRSPFLLPRVALVDPQLTAALPPSLTASTGLDALTQLIEPYVSSRATPLTDGFCRQGISCVARSLRRAFDRPDDLAARQDMSLASLLGGLALANAGLGAVHGLAAPLGGMFPVPHGTVCAALLPHVMEANVAALQARASAHPALSRYTEIARLLTGDPAATIQAGIAWVTGLCHALQIPRLSAFEVQLDTVPTVVDKASVASSMRANPINLTSDELRNVLLRAL